MLNEDNLESFPFPHELLFDIFESKELILSFLDILPSMIKPNNSEVNPPFAKVLDISIKMIKKTGGRIFLMQAQDNLYGSVYNHYFFKSNFKF